MSKVTIDRIKVKFEKTTSNFGKMTQSMDTYNVLKQIYDKDTVEYLETVYALFLDSKNKVIGFSMISSGGMNQCLIDPRIVFSQALLSGAIGVIISHNHPSGSLEPSAPDKSITKKLIECGKILEIRLLDHIIYTTESYYSFADEGYI